MTLNGTLQGGARLLPHLVAIALGMTYAWHVSQSQFVTTGLQFIAPLLIILLSHLAFLAVRGQLVAGYARIALLRTSLTTILLIGLIIATELLTPASSHAAGGEVFEQIMAVLFCVVVLAVVLAIAGSVLYLLFVLLRALKRAMTGKHDDDGVNDLGSIALAIALIIGASLEGVPGAYTFSGDGHSTASYDVAASPDAVWNAMQTATSPEFPLPDILDMFPRPVAVAVDEGTTLGANRVVLFKGREGRGKLHLRVVEQSRHQAVFKVISHTGPISHWVGIKSLTYSITDAPEGARLGVRLDYERLLAPSWIFTPMVENAVYLAMSVLARDTKIRAEQNVSTAYWRQSKTL